MQQKNPRRSWICFWGDFLPFTVRNHHLLYDQLGEYVLKYVFPSILSTSKRLTCTLKIDDLEWVPFQGTNAFTFGRRGVCLFHEETCFFPMMNRKNGKGSWNQNWFYVFTPSTGNERRLEQKVLLFSNRKHSKWSFQLCHYVNLLITLFGIYLKVSLPIWTIVYSWKSTVSTLNQAIFKIQKWSGWWFQIFFMFTPIWGRFPIWLIFFQMGWNHQPVGPFLSQLWLF